MTVMTHTNQEPCAIDVSLVAVNAWARGFEAMAERRLLPTAQPYSAHPPHPTLMSRAICNRC